jgi:small nuclear ribonucleoprotein (snRNP)-like protein
MHDEFYAASVEPSITLVRRKQGIQSIVEPQLEVHNATAQNPLICGPTLNLKGDLTMRNFPRLFVVFGLVAALLLSTVTVAAQGQMNDWSKVTALASGSNLQVKLKSGKTIKGSLSSVTDSGLSLTVKNAPVEIKREEVRTIHEVIKKGGGGGKGALIGSAVGAGAGAGLGVAADSTDNALEVHNGVTAGLAVVGAGVGALAGYFIGRSGSKRVLIYKAN